MKQYIATTNIYVEMNGTKRVHYGDEPPKDYASVLIANRSSIVHPRLVEKYKLTTQTLGTSVMLLPEQSQGEEQPQGSATLETKIVEPEISEHFKTKRKRDTEQGNE